MPAIAVVLLVSACISLAAAAAGILFIDGAARLAAWQPQGGVWLIIAPAAAGAACAAIARFLPRGNFLGLADMALFAQHGVRQRRRHHLLSAAAAFIALIGGASVGQYGPVAHLGGALASFFRALPPRVAAACGVAAAIAAAFNAPFTALVFAHEVILRHYSLRAFTPVAVSAVIGYSLSAGVFNRPLFLELPLLPALQPPLIPLFILMGALFGALAVFYVRGIFWVSAKTKALPLALRLPLAGLVTGALAFFLPAVAGGGQALLMQAADGLPPGEAALLLLAKLTATIVCLGAGFAGGVVSPTLAAGALAGLLFFQAGAALLPALPALMPAALPALIGMMALTAPVIGAPLAGILFTMELSGSYPAAIAAAVAIAVAVQIKAKLSGFSYYDRQLAERGYNLRLRRDEWQMENETIAALARPAALTMPPGAALAAALEQALARQCGEFYIADENGVYGGRLTLAAALTLPRDLTLRQAAERIPPAAPPLPASISPAEAMRRLENFTGGAIAVVDAENRFIGIISEGDLLRRCNALARECRREEAAA